MKKNHPKKNIIIFLDNISNYKFLNISTINCKENIKINNNQFKLKIIEISSKSHNYYTKLKKIINISNRIEKFKKKYLI